MRHALQRGYTIFEIAVVLAIGGIILAISVPAVQSYIDRARVAQAITDIARMSVTIKQYSRSRGAYPDSLADVSLDSLNDPWGRPYQYFNLTAKGNGGARRDKKLNPLNSDYDLYSVGADGDTALQLTNSKSRDDVVRARDGGFIGLAADFDP